jgi:hypothetical protein
MVETILVPTAYMNKAKLLVSTITKIAAFAALIITAAAQFILYQQQSLALEQQQQQQQPQQQNQIALSEVIK